ncbi:hypothetical protein FRC03_012959 [Tulasnella sp. 419]|nr:hypothetical protein FRC03_012959 [Tulasnella sp. 419]
MAGAYLNFSDDMLTLQSRLDSYTRRPTLSKSTKSKKVGWPHPPSFKATPETLAAAGFFYKSYNLKSVKIMDEVECFMCHHSLGGWEEMDDPFEEHAARIDQTNCPWAIAVCSIQRDKDAEQKWIFHDEHRLPTSRSMENARLATFSNLWPHDGVRGHSVSSKKMAKAGFVYYPTEKSNDMARCPYCRIGFDDWQPRDNPLALHLERRPECPIFTGQLYVEPTEEEEEPVPARTSSRKTATKPSKAKKPSSSTSKLSSEPSSDTRTKRSNRTTHKAQPAIEEEASDHGATEQEEDEPEQPRQRKASSRSLSQTAATLKSKSSSSKSKKPKEPVKEQEEEEEEEDEDDIPPKASSSQTGTLKSTGRTQSRTQVVPQSQSSVAGSKGTSKSKSQTTVLQPKQEVSEEPAPPKQTKKGKQKMPPPPPPPASPSPVEESEDELAANPSPPPPPPKARSTRTKKATATQEVLEEVSQLKKSRAAGTTVKKKGKTKPPVEVVETEESAMEETIPEEMSTAEPEEDEPLVKSKSKAKATKGKSVATKKKGKPATTGKTKRVGKVAPTEEEDEVVESQLEDNVEAKKDQVSEVSAGEESAVESAMEVDDTGESVQELQDEPMQESDGEMLIDEFIERSKVVRKKIEEL